MFDRLMVRNKRFIHGFFNLFFPNHFTQQITFEARVFKANLFKEKYRRKFKGKKEMLINVGSGDKVRSEWVNVDVFSQPGVNVVCDCRKMLPFDDNSAKGMFSEHFIEHVDFYDEIPILFKEMFRVLQPGGILRIIVPDGEKYLNAYSKPDWEAMTKVRPLNEEHVDIHTGNKMHTKMEMVNWVFRQCYEHKFAYDFETLELKLREAGFSKIIKQDFNRSLNPVLLLDMPHRASESLYIDAVK